MADLPSGGAASGSFSLFQGRDNDRADSETYVEVVMPTEGPVIEGALREQLEFRNGGPVSDEDVKRAARALMAIQASGTTKSFVTRMDEIAGELLMPMPSPTDDPLPSDKDMIRAAGRDGSLRKMVASPWGTTVFAALAVVLLFMSTHVFSKRASCTRGAALADFGGGALVAFLAYLAFQMSACGERFLSTHREKARREAAARTGNPDVAHIDGSLLSGSGASVWHHVAEFVMWAGAVWLVVGQWRSGDLDFLTLGVVLTGLYAAFVHKSSSTPRVSELFPTANVGQTVHAAGMHLFAVAQTAGEYVSYPLRAASDFDPASDEARIYCAETSESMHGPSFLLLTLLSSQLSVLLGRVL